jgi:protein-S-isoprenylcysteine O-methyltransferase Ste14
MALYWFWIVLEVWVAVGRRAAKADAAGKDRGTQLLLWAVIVLSLTANGFLRHLALAPMHASESWMKPAALAVLAVGLVVRVAAIVTLGRAFSANVATRSDQQLQRAGLYKIVRHPSYLGMEIIFLAIGLHTMDWVCLAVALVPTTLAVLRRIGVEEEALRGLFGAEYEEYSRTTKRLIPGIY